MMDMPRTPESLTLDSENNMRPPMSGRSPFRAISGQGA